ncbi:hypothetical protein HC031_13240 [Planosporangium thailandense]|uniref:DsrE family protein n=1 Tax=Planosporangium thailandense TaxID=765197 RepID=A0ABX0XZN4_9ACTN|nr:DsrE family protein [Planosporangium thailandense]NJC70670.1 hypothetical protein [Planosporangium thailandense]
MGAQNRAAGVAAVPTEQQEPAWHLLIESQGPFAGPACASFLRDAATLAASGEAVTLLLLQDGVGAAVEPGAPTLADPLARGVRVWADDFSVAQRGIHPDDLPAAVRVVSMSDVAELVLLPGVRVVWH